MRYLMLLALCFCAFSVQLLPENLDYVGAFRLPDSEPYDYGWYWGGRALSYYPDGDPDGPSDGHPGSLYGVGHVHNSFVAEIDIPTPFNSPTKNVDELPTANFLQPFTNIRGSMFDGVFDAFPIRHGLAILPPMGAQVTGKIYACFGQHYQYDPFVSHLWCELDLSSTVSGGAWFFDGYSNFSTNDYMCEIPADWAIEHVSGYRLASGRFRDGGLGGKGPALFAAAPWLDGNPPAPNTTLEHIIPLLLYDDWEVYDDPDTMIDYKAVDEWDGVAWIQCADTHAVIFVGTKGFGNCWYGFSDGTLWPNDSDWIPPHPHNDRGWWADSLFAVFHFFDPDEFAEVAAGRMAPNQPQPYASMRLADYLHNVTWHLQKDQIGACAYDPERRLLYVLELLADDDKPLCHVWRIQTSSASVAESPNSDVKINYITNLDNRLIINFESPSNQIIDIDIYDIEGRKISSQRLLPNNSSTNNIELPVYSTGVYICQVRGIRAADAKRFVVVR